KGLRSTMGYGRNDQRFFASLRMTSMTGLVQSAAHALTKRGSTLPWPMQLAVPAAALLTFGIYLLFFKNAPPLETHSYMLLFWEIVFVSIALAIVPSLWPALRQLLW